MNDPNELPIPEVTDEHRAEALKRLLCDTNLVMLYCQDRNIDPFVPHQLYVNAEGTPLRNGSLSDNWLREEWDTYMDDFVRGFHSWLRPERIETMAYNVMDEEFEAAKQDEADYIRLSREDDDHLFI